MTVFHFCVILICITITGFTVSVLAKSLPVGTSNQMFVGGLSYSSASVGRNRKYIEWCGRGDGESIPYLTYTAISVFTREKAKCHH